MSEYPKLVLGSTREHAQRFLKAAGFKSPEWKAYAFRDAITGERYSRIVLLSVGHVPEGFEKSVIERVQHWRCKMALGFVNEFHDLTS